MSVITKHVTEKDIDLLNKLDNMLGSEISEEIYNRCNNPKTLKKIEDKIWRMMKNSASPFSKSASYIGFANDYATNDEHERWSACVYNCDLLYMTAIASVLGLELPRHSGDVHIFGIN